MTAALGADVSGVTVCQPGIGHPTRTKTILALVLSCFYFFPERRGSSPANDDMVARSPGGLWHQPWRAEGLNASSFPRTNWPRRHSARSSQTTAQRFDVYGRLRRAFTARSVPIWWLVSSVCYLMSQGFGLGRSNSSHFPTATLTPACCGTVAYLRLSPRLVI